MLDYNLEATWSDLCLVICLFIGLVKLLRISLRLMLPFTWSRIDLQSKFGGGWAVVTGGSEGIGLALCEELAKEGFHICIISRSETKLNSA